MKQVFLVGALAAALVAGAAAQADIPQGDKTAAPAAVTQPPPPPTPPVTPPPPPVPRPVRRAIAEMEGKTGHTTPKPQPATEAPTPGPSGEIALGSVRLTAAAKADGKPLAAGTYQVRVTPQEATPDAKGQTEQRERWVEFMKGGQVVGREVVVIIPQAEIDKVQKDPPPRANGYKVEKLVGGDYYRVWVNKGGTHYLIYLVA